MRNVVILTFSLREELFIIQNYMDWKGLELSFLTNRTTMVPSGKRNE